jgi:hypothetical protein
MKIPKLSKKVMLLIENIQRQEKTLQKLIKKNMEFSYLQKKNTKEKY